MRKASAEQMAEILRERERREKEERVTRKRAEKPAQGKSIRAMQQPRLTALCFVPTSLLSLLLAASSPYHPLFLFYASIRFYPLPSAPLARRLWCSLLAIAMEHHSFRKLFHRGSALFSQPPPLNTIPSDIPWTRAFLPKLSVGMGVDNGNEIFLNNKSNLF